MLVTLLLLIIIIIRSIGQNVAACLHVVKCVKWSSFVADRITLLCMCTCVRMYDCTCMCLVCQLSMGGYQLKIVYAWLVRDLSTTCTQLHSL